MKSEVSGNADLLSLFLSSPDIFTDDDIIDELVDFLLAGTQTTTYAILTMLSHLAKSKESMQAIRAEFNKASGASSTEGGGAETTDQKFARLMSSATLEAIQDQEYLSWVLNETLRHQTSIRQNTGVRCDHNMKIGSYNIRANDSVMINFHSLHHNPLQWQRPNEFLPKRFDPSSPLYLTPSGFKRHAYSFVPFNGGSRVCFGKTFAESTLKMIAIYTSQLFDLEILGAKY